MPVTPDTSLPPILPSGTQVVALTAVRGPDGQHRHPRGALGVVVVAPADATHAYRVRFGDGAEASFRRHELSVLAHYQRPLGTSDPAPADPLAEQDLYRHVILRVVVGSRAYGLDGPASDTDRRGIYLPPADRHWSLYGVPEQLENDATQETYWELQKFLTMALKANPNVLEVLYTPLVEHATPLAQELLGTREAFLSKLVYQTYSGYVMSQFRKLQGDLRNKGEVKWKHVMHLIRLLLAGVTTLREGRVPVDAGEHRDRLLAIKRGEVPWDEVEAWRLRLHAELDLAYEQTTLPDRPDYERAEAFLLRARRSVA
jgi:predicted nucleotidyltransferase